MWKISETSYATGLKAAGLSQRPGLIKRPGSLRIVEQTTLVGIACLLFNRGRSSIMLSEIRRTPVDDGMTMEKGIFYVW